MCIILENQGYQNWSQYKCCILGSVYTVHKKKGNRMFDVEYHNNVYSHCLSLKHCLVVKSAACSYIQIHLRINVAWKQTI